MSKFSLSILVTIALTTVSNCLIFDSNAASSNLSNIYTNVRELPFKGSGLVLLNDYGHSILVGGRNAAYNVSTDKLSIINKYVWKTERSALRNCESISKDSAVCDNFIRTFFSPSPHVFVLCGSHGLQPTCAEFIAGSSIPSRFVSGIGLAAVDAQVVSPFFADGPTVFSANVPELSSSEPLIMRRDVSRIVDNDLSGKDDFVLRTSRGQSAFEDASFVAMYPNGQEILTFFSEVPLESEGCGLRKVARIGRVCRDDPGGRLSYSQEWTSFVKAQLECAIEEEDQDTLYFNQLASISPSSQYFYGAFRSQLAGIGASAICRYNRKLISSTISSAYNSSQSKQQSCSRAKTFEEFTSLRIRPLIKNKISSKPIFSYNGDDRFVHVLAVDDIEDLKGNQFDVLYIATNRGNIFKIVIAKEKSIEVPRPRHALTFQNVFPASSNISSMSIYTEKLHNKLSRQFLIVVTSEKVIKLSTVRCKDVISCADCLAMGDPECAWMELEAKCINIREHSSQKEFMSQDSGTCRSDIDNRPVAVAPLRAPNIQPTCLCEITSQSPCTTEVIQKEIIVQEGILADVSKCIALFAFGLVVGGIVNYFYVYRKSYQNQKESSPSISPIDAYRSSQSVNNFMTNSISQRCNTTSMHSSIHTYC